MDWDYDTYIYVVSCHGNHSSPISPSWVSCPAIWLSHQHAVSSAQATWLSAQAIKAVSAWLSHQQVALALLALHHQHAVSSAQAIWLSYQHAVSSAQAIKAVSAWPSHQHIALADPASLSIHHQHAVSSAQAIIAVPAWLSYHHIVPAVPALLSQQHAVSSAQAIKAIPAWLSHHHAISSGSFHPLPLIIEFFMRLTFLLCQLERCIISWNMNVQRVCQKLNLLLRRNLFRRHDFAMAIQKLATSLTLFRTKYSIVLYIILQLCTVMQLRKWHIGHTSSHAVMKKYKVVSCLDSQATYVSPCIGGGLASFTLQELELYLTQGSSQNADMCFKYKDYVLQSQMHCTDTLKREEIVCDVPIHVISPKLTVKELQKVAACHRILTHSKMRRSQILDVINNHMCENCAHHVSLFEVIDLQNQIAHKKANNLEAVRRYQAKQGEKYKTSNLQSVQNYQEKQGDTYKAAHLTAVLNNQQKQGEAFKIAHHLSVKKNQKKQGDAYKVAHLLSVRRNQHKKREHYKQANLAAALKYQESKKAPVFPPNAPTPRLQHKIISGACMEMSPDVFQEAGCMICGRLTPLVDLIDLVGLNLDFNILVRQDVTRKERQNLNEPISQLDGPAVDSDLSKICRSCHGPLSKGKVPLHALANGNWIGKVPKELTDLSFAEQLLVARVRHNRCIVRVSSGMHKMRANAISFANPIPKVYDILPPPIEELDEVLAFIYTGPCKPTKSDFERTPLLVRKNKVRAALEWLKLNHSDYYDLEISQRNLDQYPEDVPPVVVDYHQSFVNKDPESTAVHDNEEEDGTETGKCPFVVHGLTGEEYSTKTAKALKAIALKHLTSNRKILAIGCNEKAENSYDNPHLFPQMMPWLFPYGLGGIGNDLQWGPLSDIAHKRHLLMYHDKRFQKDPYFPLIAFNHEQMNQASTGGYLLAQKSKFEDISKRLMDVDIGVLDYLVRKMEDGERVIPDTDEEKLCFQLIKDLDHAGGHVKGSLTSKKYMRNEIWSLISFMGAPSWFITFAPADNRHPISLYYADTQETFQPELRGYEERYRLIAQNPVAGARFFHFICEMFIKHVLGVGTDHPGIYGETGAFYGTVEQQGRLTLHLHLLLWILGALSPQEIRDRVMDPKSDFQQKMVEYLESVHIGEFMTGTLDQVETEVGTNQKNDKDYKDPTQTLPEAPPPLCDNSNDDCAECGCLENWWDKFKHTVDDLLFRSNVHNCRRNQSTGEKANKKDRPSCINKDGHSITPALTYLLRCNTDVTSLLSGTAIKAVVAYVSDYVTKPGLKTYSIFDTIRSVFRRNSEMLGGSLDHKEKARKLIIKIINALTAKMEIGAPMASLYLLGNPDHYTSHKFIPVYWKNYVREAMNAWKSPDDMDVDGAPEKLVLQKSNRQYVGYSSVHDYIYRPEVYSDKTLYEWVQMSKRIKKPTKATKTIDSDAEDELDLVESSIPQNLKISESEISVLAAEAGSEAEQDKVFITDDDKDDNDDDFFDDAPSETEDDEETPVKAFLKNHPLYDTYVAQFDPRKQNIVPNFIGGSLPRRDRGDREYYCATMLTLFKPWRSGRDLKIEEYSWDETFINHEFTSRQTQLMDNFNIRYECNDARDDFSAQLKKGNGAGGMFPQWMSTDVTDELDEIDQNGFGDDFGDGEGIDDEDYGDNKYSTLSARGLAVKAQMDATENSVRNAGWLDESPDGIKQVNLEPLEPAVTQLCGKWKAAVQERRQELLAERTKHIPSSNGCNRMNTQYMDPNANDVKIVDQSYLTHGFKFKSIEAQKSIDQTVENFNLNTEQERAFRIIANHAVTPQVEHLKMYLGGMGGTGKSQVIKALIDLFRQRNETHRFVVLGPTGTSAALLGGSTYHSFLGIRSGDSVQNQSVTMAQIRGRLEGVDYIFLDEVSMLACHAMYKISSQLAKALNIHDIPFGGLNMIFAGDFAQLPPVGGTSLYSGYVGTQCMTPDDQKAAIGKALWHQVTTVVILRENMRQKSQTPEDAALRTALVNMRYGACTPADMQFLRSRIAGRRPEQPKVSARDFRNVAIICGVHTQKDMINQLGCQRFADETGQKLTNFYSVDKWGKGEDPADGKKKKGKSKAACKPKHESSEIDFDDQLEIWKLRHGATDHFPGKLSLCIGMPVIIKNNDATELCITNGQEGFVVGWQSTKGPHDKRVLDTLFVELDNPPQLVQIPGLPDNVVPIIKSKRTINCVFPSDLKESIQRQQGLVLPNFAMTAHAAQGKTRPYNPVHLNSCRDHMAYYTALSRSATAAGTIIIQGFDSKVITKGCSGYLRQEFREQELLDDITRLRYEGQLPAHINGNLRNTLLHLFQQWKGLDYVPPKTDKCLRWSSDDPLDLIPMVTDSTWQILDKSNNSAVATTLKAKKAASAFVPARGSQALTARQKRAIEDDKVSSPSKKQKTSASSSGSHNNAPIGLVWDADNHSCAYDALFVILHDIWLDNPRIWSKWFRDVGNKHLTALSKGFKQYLKGELSLEDVRDSVRHQLHIEDPDAFPLGDIGASVGRLASEMLRTSHFIASSQLVCTTCDYEGAERDHRLGYVLCPAESQSNSRSTSKLVENLSHEGRNPCPECMGNTTKDVFYNDPPKLLVIEYPGSSMKTSHKIKFETDTGLVYLHLRGVIYEGGYHFTSHIVCNDGSVWYHDGISTGHICHADGSLNLMTDQAMRTCRGRKLVLAIYAQD